jgi:pimeloyl-ACP methyl ester carboxylesterase
MTETTTAAVSPAGILPRPDGATIAYRKTPGRAPGVVFLGGFQSDMTGNKAVALETHCLARGQAFLRFDYGGHGASSGRFEDGSVARWAEDAQAALDELTQGPQVLVGSSMGGWIALLLAQWRPERVKAVIGVAAAPDFTERLIFDAMPPEEQHQLMRDGRIVYPAEPGGAPYVVTRRLIEESRKILLLSGAIKVACPVRLIHGMKDADVPWRWAPDIAERLAGSDVRVTLVKEGDHRLSRPEDLALLWSTMEEFI